MGRPKGSNGSSDREKWNKVFNALVRMLQTQQTQLQSLAKERKLLEDRIKVQYDRWVSDINLFQDQIFQTKSDFTLQEMERVLEAARSDLVLGLKQREAFMCKLKLDNAQDELADFKAWFDYLSRKCSEPENISKTVTNKGEEQHCKALQSELRRLKCDNEKLSSKNNSEISALLAERNFVWNQYNMMESDLTDQLKSKRAVVERANEKIQKLLTSMEQLQSSNTHKDKTIVTLKANMAKLESDTIKKSEEISRLSRELELLTKSRSNSVTPVVRHCTSVSGGSRKGGKNSGIHGRNIIPKKESVPLEVLEKESRSSKRKAVEIISISETPKLFTSQFKIPKVKNSSLSVN